MDGSVYENYGISVPRFAGAYAYPYVAKLVGPNEIWGVEREFQPRPVKLCCCPTTREFRTDFETDGIYEIGMKAWDIETKECIWKQHTYVLVQEGDVFPITAKEAFNQARKTLETR